MRPLEVGCRAIVISDKDNQDNVGKEVVLQFKLSIGETARFGFILNGKALMCSGKNLATSWVVNGNVKTFVNAEGKREENGEYLVLRGLAESYIAPWGEIHNAVFEPHQLMRIDDFSDEDKQKDREREIGRGLLKPVLWVCD